MRESEVTGYSEEGCDEPQGAVGYAPETVYEAHVNAYVSIYFMFSYRQNVKRVSIMRSDVSDGHWNNYYIGTATEIQYFVPAGMWILRLHVGHQPDWLFKLKDSGNLRSPTISRAWGKHHPDEEYGKNDMVDAAIYGTACTPAEYAKEEVRRTLKWFEKAKKEVKKKMELQLIDVIFFNKKTKKIDYRENIVAKDIEEAYMIAAQAFGGYSCEVHIREANCILSFVDDYVELPK